MFQRSSIGSSGATEWQGGAGQSGLAASDSGSGCSLPECIEPGRKSEGDQNIISCFFPIWQHCSYLDHLYFGVISKISLT
jgi:hypothetical protein